MEILQKRATFFILIYLILAGFFVFGEVPPEKNILLITLDTTRADHIGCYNDKLQFTPNIDKLGEEGVIYENCYTNVPLTLPAHASILTGKHPFELNVRNNGRYFLNKEHTSIAELLKEKGYHTFAVISSYVLSAKFGLSQGFDIYDDSLNTGEMNTTQSAQIPADKVFNKFRILLNRTGKKKFFGWLHFYDPHTPYSPPGEFRKKFEKDLYLGEIAYMDMYIGKTIKLLRDKGILNNTIIIIAGDHGEDKGEHRELGHGIFCYEVSLRVPLIIWNNPMLPGGKRVSETVILTDIFEAVKNMSGTLSPGKSTPPLISYPDSSTNEERDVYFESIYAKEEMGWSPLTGILHNGFKYISLPEPELYNLKSNPEETENLINGKKELAIALDKKLGLFYSKRTGISRSGKKELSSKDREHLASLGYISSFKKSDKMIDPKKGIRYMDKLRRIRTAVSEGELSSAERDLKKLFFSRERIDTIHAYEIFDALYKKKGDMKNLIKFRELAVKNFPDNQVFANLLANSYFFTKRFDDAERICMATLKKNRKNTQAIVLQGKISINRKALPKALSHFRKAEELEPMNLGIKRNIAFVLRRMGQRSEAVRILEKISGDKEFRKNPDNKKFLSAISLQLFNTGASKKSIAILEELISYHPEDASVYVSLGIVFSKTDKHSKAITYYKKALEVDPDHALAHSKTGISNLMIFMKGRDPLILNKANDSFSKSIALDPDIAESYSGRGTVNVFLKNTDDAIRDLATALKLDPDLIDVYFNLGIMYLRTGDKARANEVFTKCKKRFYQNFNQGQKRRLDNLLKESR